MTQEQKVQRTRSSRSQQVMDAVRKAHVAATPEAHEQMCEVLMGLGFVEVAEDDGYVLAFETGEPGSWGAAKILREFESGWRNLPGAKKNWRFEVEVVDEPGDEPVTGKLLMAKKSGGRVRSRLWVRYEARKVKGKK